MPWGEPFIELMMSMRYASSSPSGPASVSRMWLMCAQHAMAPGSNKLELARMVHVWRVWRDDYDDDDDWRGWLVARDDVGATSATTRLAA